MIMYSLARSKQVRLPISRENYSRLDAERAVILQREGPMDMIMDFTTSPTTEFPTELARKRAFFPIAGAGPPPDLCRPT